MTHITSIEVTPSACNTEGLPADTNTVNFRTDAAIKQALDSKAIATQLARLAIAGHVVHKGSTGDYTICKYGMTRYGKDFARQ